MSTVQRPVVLHVVVDSQGVTAAFGELQIAWLLEHGHVARAATLPDHHVYRALDPDDARGIHNLVIEQSELRECDFCRQVPTHWAVHHRPFDLTHGPMTGRMERPLYACDVCARYIEHNDKRGLIAYCIASTVEHARGKGGYLTAVVQNTPRHRLEAFLTPMVREVVWGMFANRRGRPERIEGSR